MNSVFKKDTRSEVRTHAGIPPLELKSNALTTRPSWLCLSVYFFDPTQFDIWQISFTFFGNSKSTVLGKFGRLIVKVDGYKTGWVDSYDWRITVFQISNNNHVIGWITVYPCYGMVIRIRVKLKRTLDVILHVPYFVNFKKWKIS